MATPGNIFHTITPALGLTAGMRTVSRASAIAGGSQNLNCRIPFHGVVLGVLGSGIVAVFTFVIRRHLPYRRMLVATGVLLGGVLLVMVVRKRGPVVAGPLFTRWGSEVEADLGWGRTRSNFLREHAGIKKTCSSSAELREKIHDLIASPTLYCRQRGPLQQLRDPDHESCGD